MKLLSNFNIVKYGLKVRLVNENDAKFIVQLRTNPKLSRYIHPTGSDINKQIEWIKAYKLREEKGNEFYFVFSIGNKPVGLNRIYNIEEESFTSGSWVFDPAAPFESSVASALITRTIAFELLGKEIENSFDGCHIENKKVLKFNLMLGMKITGTRTEVMGTYYTFSLTKSDFYINKPKIERLISYQNE